MGNKPINDGDGYNGSSFENNPSNIMIPPQLLEQITKDPDKFIEFIPPELLKQLNKGNLSNIDLGSIKKMIMSLIEKNPETFSNLFRLMNSFGRSRKVHNRSRKVHKRSRKVRKGSRKVSRKVHKGSHKVRKGSLKIKRTRKRK
jgi:hypothetical protein